MALQVVGAGLARTGTLSLKFALEHLGFGPCCHATELLATIRQQIPKWMKVFAGAPDWDEVFAGYVSAVDYPTCSYWRELSAYYPDSKIILTTRDPEAWFDSLQRTLLARENVEKIENSPVSAILKTMNQGASLVDPNDRDLSIANFKQWQADVIAAVPPERLLVYRVSEGWEPLCAFLDVKVPAEKFPSVNSSDELKDDGLGKGDGSSFESIEAGASEYLAEMRQKAFA